MNRIRLDHPDEQEMRISHETIYDWFYLESKGRLKDLGLSLPTGRIKRRRPGRARTGKDTDRFVDAMTLIDERPNEVEECILPGHWEGVSSSARITNQQCSRSSNESADS